ncbi:MAG: 50S ribosomal protein L9 [Candidatus Saelkia tenebricola]|nr:50S ribosomal protein L9 [Candidatus Saelkia tenebricola]
MKIILLQDYKNLGSKGQIRNVKKGYARNFLIPQGFAQEATTQVLNDLERRNLIEDKKKQKKLSNLEDLKKSLSKVSITIGVKAGEEKKMYGAVTNIDIAKALKDEGFDIDRHAIMLDEPIKELGVYQVPICLHSDIKTQVKIWVVKE